MSQVATFWPCCVLGSFCQAILKQCLVNSLLHIPHLLCQIFSTQISSFPPTPFPPSLLTNTLATPTKKGEQLITPNINLLLYSVFPALNTFHYPGNPYSGADPKPSGLGSAGPFFLRYPLLHLYPPLRGSHPHLNGSSSHCHSS